MNFPADRQYAETHEWMRKGPEGVTVGITDYAQGELTDVVFVDLPEVDRHVDAGEELCSLESVKAVGYVYAPVAGIVTAVNERLKAQPELVNQDPYDEGWIASIAPDEPGESVDLLDAAAYRRRVEAEAAAAEEGDEEAEAPAEDEEEE